MNITADCGLDNYEKRVELQLKCRAVEAYSRASNVTTKTWSHRSVQCVEEMMPLLKHIAVEAQAEMHKKEYM